MRPLRRLVLSLLFACAAALPAFAVDPDDTPWDDSYRNAAKSASPSADGQTEPSDPIGDLIKAPDANGDTAADAAPGNFSADRLEPVKQRPTVEAAAPAVQPPPAAAAPAEAAPAPAPVPPAHTTPAPVLDPKTVPERTAMQPQPTAGPSADTGRLEPTQAPAAAPAPQSSAPQATPAAPPTQTAAPAPLLATVPDPNKLYLPIRRYFDTKAAVTLKDYDDADRAALTQYYDGRMGEVLWVDKAGFNAAGQSLIEEIKKADDWGLSAADFKLPVLTKSANGADLSEDELADAEIKVSLAAMEYARHARGDRIDTPNEQLSSYLDRKPQLIERPKLLEALAAAPDKGAYLRGLHPKHVQFERLRQKLLTLRAQGKEEEFEKIPDGPKITPGKSHWQVALVRKRLKVPNPGMKPDGTAADETYFDEQLAGAVMRFKEKNGLEPANATISTDLRRALNTTGKLDERQLLANMEEWRWMPEDLGALHIEVNVPEFLVRVVKNGTIIHEERVVTGKVDTQTPIFTDMMRTIVFQPVWNVPESIKINELLPKLRGGGNPIEGQGLVIQRNGHDVDVWDVDWQRQDIRNYYIFQPPGDGNVLGVVKFLFPNKHSVYLHDTPSKRLFNERVRTFSHGCMRVRNPVRLAEVILAEDKGWDTDTVAELITSGPENNDIALDHPIPVHVMYFTNWVADSGELKTFADVYGHEQRIKLGLEGRWNEIVKNRDHLLPPEDSPIARGSDEWGDEDALSRASLRQRYSYRDEMPPPPGRPYQVMPQKRHVNGVGDLINKILGGY
jgi:murein L,D-transpeptidase YcbB/YkuD